MDKANLILNSTIELVDVQEEGNGKGRPFISRFLEPGIAHYKELGDILITKETLNKFIHTMVGCPVIIEHEDVTDENADKLRVGVVSRVWFNEMDGYFYCEGILTDPEAIDLVKNQGYNVSCAYSFVSDNTKKTHNGKEIDMEFIDGEFLHLALVKDPRYEGANIVVNSLVKNAKDWDGNEGDWITIKGNHLFIKKGQSKDEAVKEFLEGKKETGSKDYETGDKITFDTNWRGVNEKISEGTIIGKEKKLGTKDDPNPDYQYKVKTSDGKTILVEKEAIKPKGKSGDSGEKGKENDKIITHDKWNLKDFEEIKANETLKKDNTYIARKEIKYDNKVLPAYSEMKYKGNGEYEISGKNYKLNIDKYNLYHKKENKENQNEVGFKGQFEFKKQYKKEFGSAPFYFDGTQAVDEKTDQNIKGATLSLTKEELTKKINEYFNKNKIKEAKNSIGEITMTVLNDLTDFIKKVVKNEKDEEMKEVKNEDKRKLIDEVGGILKGKVDEELWRTVIGKLEKVAYEPSEDSKADNEDDKEEAKNKCKNEDDEKEEEIEEKVTENEDKEEDKKEDKEDKAENKKVKNSMKDIVMGGSSQAQTQKLYTSRKERLEEGNKY